MMASKLSRIKDYFKQHLIILKVGLLTGLVIVLFEIINFFVIYQHIKLDYYLSVIAVLFLLTGIWISKNNPKGTTGSSAHLLTSKEMQILRLIASGKTNKEIASIHFVEISTVKTHINNIYSKLALKNRREACVKYHEIAGTIASI